MPASPATARALPPSATISAASASSRSLRLAVITTAAPARARAAAVAYPMPELAPVTMAVFPERGLFMIVLLFVTDPVDGAGFVIRNEHAAVGHDLQIDRPSPDLAVLQPPFGKALVGDGPVLL